MKKILNVIESGKSGKRVNPVIVVGSEATFSNGLSISCGFRNGFFCPICNVVTEHIEKAGYRRCAKCGLTKAYLVSTISLSSLLFQEEIKRCSREKYAFFKAIEQFSVKIEIDAIAPLLNRRKGLTPFYYSMLKRNFPSYEFEVEN